MEISIEKTGKDSKKLTPQSVRDILGVDNTQILDLCKRVNLAPKRACDGQIYFSKDDVEILKRLKELHKVTSNSNNTDNDKFATSVPTKFTGKNHATVNALNQLKESIESINEKIVGSITKLLEDKLDGMDDIVVELIRCKTENENLRFKINELNKENFALKNKITAYKPLAFNLFYKDSDE